MTEDPYWNVNNMLYGNATDSVIRNVYYPAVVQSGNIYGYGLNSPLKFVDPSGNFVGTATIAATNWWNPIGWIAAGVTVVVVIAVVVEAADEIDEAYEDAKKKGTVAPKHTTKQQNEGENDGLEAKGTPNSSADLKNSDGEIKQRRYYGPDGKAQKDIDYKHSDGDNTHTFPHEHPWDWTKTPPRQ